MKKFIVILLTVVMTMCSVSYTYADETDADETAAETTAGETVDASSDNVSLSGVRDVEHEYNFETVFENNDAILLLDKSVCAFRVVSKKTGSYYDTKNMEGQVGNETIKNSQKSDFTLTYYTDKQIAATRSIDNYTMSILLNQVEYEPIENGIRCKFLLGEANTVQLSMFPMYISIERMENDILPLLDDAQREQMVESVNASYYSKTSTRYIRRWNTYTRNNEPTKVPIMALNRLYDLLYNVAGYTSEDLMADNMEWGEEVVDMSISFEVYMDYVLDETDLLVSLPVDEIVINSNTPERYPISDITLNPYLISGDIYDEGYLFVPDGYGGIIDFNNGKAGAAVLQLPIYGSDILKSPYFYTEDFVQSTLPVIGMKKNDITLLGIIEEGAEIATVTANVSGKMDEFNKANVRYDVLYMERMPITISFGNESPQYANESFNGTLRTRYKMLEGDQSGYVGMAKAYKEYLEQHQAIKQNPIEENAPLFVEMIGSMPLYKSFFGINYTAYQSLTSFDDAINILDSLKSNGVKNIVTQYTSWANGGFYNDPYNSIKPIGSIGGKSGFNKLLSYAGNEDVKVFPAIDLLTTNTTKGLNKNKDLTRYLNNQRAQLPEFNMVTKQTFMERWLISPNYLSTYVSKILNSMNKLKMDNIMVTDAGALFYGDYSTKDQKMRYEVMSQFTDSLNALDEGSNVMLSNANSYAYEYASYITDLPVVYSERRVINYGVPFTQMVLENDVPYSMEAFNSNTNQSIDYYMLKAIETKSNLKFTFTQEDESYFTVPFGINEYFETQYSRWEDKIGGYYDEYNNFYQKVKNAEIKEHKVDNQIVTVTYDNGVKVYLNYGNTAETVDGNEVAPLTYIVKG